MVEDLHSVVSDEELYLKIKKLFLLFRKLRDLHRKVFSISSRELLQHLAKRCIKGF